ncbi:unnamed protein product, partial [Medioppia subpectinata]
MEKIIPDVVDTVPNNIIKIHYPSGVDVNLGNELTPLSVKDEPTVQWPTEEGEYYTLAMVDPDAGEFAQVKHWLVVNILGNDVSKGEILVPYGGSRPPKTSLNRYIFLVYKQSGHLKHTETPIASGSRVGRIKFNIRQFAFKYNLGQPFAGNLYLAKGDEYSEQLRAQRLKEQQK